MVDDITDLKRMEQELEESEEKYRTLLETMVQGVVYQDADGKIVSANPAAERILGLTVDQMQGRTSFDPRWRAIHENGSDFLGETHPSMVALKTGKEVRNVVMGVFNPKSEEYCWININAVPQFKSGETKPYRVYTALDDITDRKRAEDALRTREQQLSSIQSNVADILFLLSVEPDDRFRFLSVNQSFLDATGLTEDQVVGKDVREVIPEPSLTLVLQNYRQAIRDIKTMRWEEVTDYPAGRKCGDVSVTPVLDANGRCINLAGTVHDITKRKRMEEELQESERELAGFMSSATDGFMLLDRELKCVRINETALRIMRRSKQDVLGERMETAFHATEMHLLPDRLRRVLKTGEPLSIDDLTLPAEFGGVRLDLKAFKVGEGLGIIVTDITERRKAEEALKDTVERERLLADLIRYASLPVSMGYPDGRIGNCNPAFSELTGYTEEELKTIDWNLNLTPPEWREPTSAKLRELVRTKKAVRYEKEYIRKDGSRVPIELVVHPRFDSEGNLQYYFTFITDITERRRAEEALHQSEEKFRGVVEGTAAGVGITDLTGCLTYVNGAFADLMGYSVQELMGRSFVDFLHPEDTEKVLSLFLKGVSSSEEAPDLEFRAIRKDGSIRHLWTRPTRLTTQGKTTGFVSIITDITDRKRMEEELRRERDRAQTYLDVAGVMMVAIDAEGQVILLNRKGCEILGCPAQEAVGKSWVDNFLPPAARDEVKATWKSIMEGKLEQVEYHENPVLTSRGEERLMAWQNTPLKDAEGRITGILSSGNDITERKRMEDEIQRYSKHLEELVFERTKKLAESERRFRETADLLPQIVFEIDEKGSVQFMNRAAFAATGCTEEDFRKGLNAFHMFVLEDHDRARQGIQRIMTGETIGGREFTLLRRDGTTSPVLVYTSPIMREGKTVGLRGIAIDITERKRAEEVLHKSEEQLREAQRLAQVGSWNWVAATDTVTWSEELYRIAGRDPKLPAPTYKEHSQVYAPESWARLEKAVTRALETGEPYELELELVRPDGSHRWLIARGEAERDDSGRVIRLHGTVHDTTARKRMDEELRAARERLGYVVTSNPAVIFTAKPRADYSDYDVAYMSESVVSMLGFEPRQFIGHPEFWDDHVHPEDLRRYPMEVMELWKEGQCTFEYRFLHKDGTYRLIREQAKVVRDAAGKPVEVIGYWADVTEQKRMEAELAKSQRFAAIGETAAMVGHDLRNPLQGIATTLYLAKKTLKHPKAAKKQTATELLEMLDGEVYYMNKIVSDLQDYAAPLTAKFVPTDAAELVRKTMSTVRVPKNVKVHTTTKGGMRKAELDEFLMRRVFTNLITNAIQSMPKGGKLTIETSATDKELMVSFRDTGVGIPEEDLPKLFSPFFTTKAKGQGLGLPVCKRLVEAQGGTITAQSKVGEGSTFTVKLPLKRQ